MNRFDLTGRVALITGASGLLGVEHAIALLKNGAKVIITDVNEKSLIKAYDTLLNSENKERIFSKLWMLQVSKISKILLAN